MFCVVGVQVEVVTLIFPALTKCSVWWELNEFFDSICLVCSIIGNYKVLKYDAFRMK